MKAQTQRAIRKYHHYIGVFLAPAILLFSISGALQTFRLNEEKGWGGTPPNWMIWVAAVHKDQAPPREKRGAPKPTVPVPVAASADDHDHDAPPAAKATALPKPPSPLPLKIFVVLMAIGLIVSTLLGVTIALNNRTTRRVSILMLAAGTVLPIVLLWV
jgi:hypothetical protein